jgi:biotin carboxyl carrier protein
MWREISINGGSGTTVSLTRGGHKARIRREDGKTIDAALIPAGEDWLARADDLSQNVAVAVDRDEVLIHAFGRSWRVALIDPAQRALGAGAQSDITKAPMPGTAIAVMVKAGDAVSEGQPLVIIESMKMQMEITASRAGVVAEVGVRVGDTFPLGTALVTLAPVDGTV